MSKGQHIQQRVIEVEELLKQLKNRKVLCSSVYHR